MVDLVLIQSLDLLQGATTRLLIQVLSLLQKTNVIRSARRISRNGAEA